MAHDDEQLAITRFLEQRGATVCPTAYVAPTSTPLTSAEEQERLRQLRLQPWLSARALVLATQHAERGRRARRR